MGPGLAGWVSPGGLVWGAYVHGLFDRDAFRRAFLHDLSQACGITAADNASLSWMAFQEEQLDQLAEAVRRRLDMAKIRTLIGMA